MGQILLGCGSLLVGLAAVITAVHNGRGIRAVREEVVTGNGKTLGKLGDLAEGRRILNDIPADDRTKSERHYVEGVIQDSSTYVEGVIQSPTAVPDEPATG